MSLEFRICIPKNYFVFHCVLLIFFFFPRLTLETCCCLLTPSSLLASTQRSSDRSTREKSSRETHRQHTLVTLLFIILLSASTILFIMTGSMSHQRFHHHFISVMFFIISDCFCCSLPQPCVCHSWCCFQSVSSLHTGAVHHHKVLTGMLISSLFMYKTFCLISCYMLSFNKKLRHCMFWLLWHYGAALFVVHIKTCMSLSSHVCLLIKGIKWTKIIWMQLSYFR